MFKYTYIILALFFFCFFLSPDSTAQKKKLVKPDIKKKLTNEELEGQKKRKEAIQGSKIIQPEPEKRDYLLKRHTTPPGVIKRDKKLTPEEKCKSVKNQYVARYRRECKRDVKCLEGVEKRAQIQYEKCVAAEKKRIAQPSERRSFKGKLKKKK